MQLVQEENNNPNIKASKDKESKMVIALGITFFFLLIELFGALISNSLAILADVGHMAEDVIALLFSLFALKIASKKRNSNYSFGYKRAEVIAAFINGLFLIVISLYLLFEAYNRFGKPEIINTGVMLAVSLIGIFSNIGIFFLLLKDSHSDLNIKGAIIHVAGDVLGSIGAALASILIMLTGNVIFDIVVTLLITILITFSAINLLKQSLHILMEGIPENLDVEQIQEKLLDLKGIKNIHDVHIWSSSSNEKLFSGHFVIDKAYEQCNVLEVIKDCLLTNYQISHTTIQIEHDSFYKNCNSCDSNVI